ncbi:MAG: SAM-dependent methyltransferase [Myxococcota bacterium]
MVHRVKGEHDIAGGIQQREAGAFTRRLMVDAGIGPGMRVIDLGCGPGVVTRLIAELVGETGHVVGVDRHAGAIARAIALTEQAVLSNVSFVEQDLSDPLPGTAPHDAAVARRVLMYLPDPALLLRGVVDVLRPGGVAVFQEADASMTPACTAPHPLHDRVNDWIWTTVSGANTAMGLELAPLVERCGLIVQHVRAEADIEGHTDSMATIVRAILPRILHHTDATEAEIDVDTLQRRLAEERRQAPSMSAT